MNYTINANDQFKSNEILFTEKPDEAIRTALKNLGFRWNPKKGVWYGFKSAEEIAAAIGSGPKDTAKKTTNEIINLDNLGENTPSLHGAELAAAIREDLKKRGVKGVTVRARRITWDTGITVTIKATAEDMASIEEAKERYPYSSFACKADNGFFNGSEMVYNFSALTDEEKQEQYNKYIAHELTLAPNIYHVLRERKNYYTLTTKFYEKLNAVYKIANQWNYDNSDTMTDYFDVGYYLDIDIKLPEDITPRETMTEEEKAGLLAEREAERKAFEEWEANYIKEQAEAEERRKAYEEKRKLDREEIYNNITITDLAEAEQIYITDLASGTGKEATLAEVEETIARLAEDGNPYYTDALITRKVEFSTKAAFDTFTNYLLDDFDFLENMGGTASEDVRIGDNDYFKMTPEQRESVKTYSTNCVGFYVDGELLLVSDPQGYSYSRYTMRPSEHTTVKGGTEELKAQEEESKAKAPLYFPLPVTEQAANIKELQPVTIYQCDGWLLYNVYAGAGYVSSVKPGKYAQHEGIYINLFTDKATKSVFIRDNNKCLVYNGILPPLPEEVTSRRISPTMKELYNYDQILPNIIKYYEAQGITPLIDTIQR